jgi:hypothetical protein
MITVSFFGDEVAGVNHRSASVDNSKVESSNPVYGKVYLIQHYVIKFVSDLQQVGDLLRVPLFLHQ